MQIKSGIAYTSFKYAMYALLFVNAMYFYVVNMTAEAATSNGALTWSELIVAYADFIDSAAWLALLLLFEFETSYHPPEKYRTRVVALVGALTLFCWAVIIYSFYGYAGGLDIVRGFSAYSGPDPCGRVGGEALFAVSLDDYAALDAGNCLKLAGAAFYNAELDLFATRESLSLVNRLIWTDIVNAGAWIVVAGIIELEIFMRITRRATAQFLRICNVVKAPFWGVLVVIVFYLWALGAPVDAWDAFLWIVAFFFIELNMIAKHEENARDRPHQSPA